MTTGLRSTLCLALGGLILSVVPFGDARAASVSYSGTFTSDDQVQLYPWTLAQNTQVILSTDSYGGGAANGITTPAGGFVPVLSVFNAMGNLLFSDGADAACGGSMMADAGTGMCDDAYINTNLAAGSYLVAVSEFFNVPVGPNISDGFLMQGQGNFTGATCGASGAFYETDVAPCVPRTGNFAVTFSTVPEPATLLLVAVPLLLFRVTRKSRALSQS